MHKTKHGLRVIDREVFKGNPSRYILRVNDPKAPLCPFGNQRTYIGFDQEEEVYVRFTKSVLKQLLNHPE